MRIIFVRHGETVFNADSRYQGHTDAPLSDLGRRQAERVAERLSGEQVAAIYSSDLSRALDTAEAVARRLSLPVITDARLRECSFGDWEALTVNEIAERYPDLFENYRRDSVTHRPPNGERLEALQERVAQAVIEIVERHPNDTVVIATHGGPIRGFLCRALDMPLESFRKVNLHNGSLTILALDSEGKWFLEALNDDCHLHGLIVTDGALDETSAPDTGR